MIPGMCGVMAGFGGVTYPTLNPSDKTAGMNLSNGNLTATGTAGGWNEIRATVGRSTGKWFCEVRADSIAGGSESFIVGIRSLSGSITTVFWYSGSWNTGTFGYNYGVQDSNFKVSNGTQTSFTTNITASDYITLAFDADAGTFSFGENTSTLTQVYTGVTGLPVTFACNFFGANVATFNFGATAFNNGTPTGYSPITV